MVAVGTISAVAADAMAWVALSLDIIDRKSNRSCGDMAGGEDCNRRGKIA